MGFTAQEWFALAVSASFAAGLNLYATVATLGLLARSHVLVLPPALHSLSDWWVIGIAAAMFAVEFVADKIPAFDLLWNALHTFIRIPAAALIAYGATQKLSPQAQLISALIGAGVAMVAHSGKMAARSVVTPSPEPLSNSLLSVGEDAGAVGLTWIATQHPYVAGGITLGLIVALLFAIRWIVRGTKRFYRRVRGSTGSETLAA
jgi:Domain of unknown function (DUF4126)